MQEILSYLTFNGNCKEAMNFYKKCLGGKLSIMTIGESPMADKLPKKMWKSILHCSLVGNGFKIYGSDMVGDNGLQKGNAISLVINCNSEREIKSLYNKLSKDGNAIHPIETTFWGALFGGLIDKYGNHWLLNFNSEK